MWTSIRLLLLCLLTSVVAALVKRSANATTDKPLNATTTTTTTRSPTTATTRSSFIDPNDPSNLRYSPPRDITWVDLGYDANFDGSQTVPVTLNALPGARMKNVLFFQQMEKQLDLVPTQISNALFGKIQLSAVSTEDFLYISNSILAALSDQFLSSMSIDQQDRAVRSNIAGVMGLNRLLQRRISSLPPTAKSGSEDQSELFSLDPVKCAVLVWKLKDSSMDARFVSYKSLFKVPLSQLKPMKPFLSGLTLTMARSFLEASSYDGEQKTALLIDSFPGNTWQSHLTVCSVLFLAVYNNINQQVDQWNTPDYPELKDKIVPMFACVKPSFLLRFRFNELWPMIDELSPVDFDWQRGSAIVQQIFETSQPSDYTDQLFVRLDRLNKFLTVDVIQRFRTNNQFMNVLLTKNSLVAISDQTSDPLLMEWLYSEVRSQLYPKRLREYTSDQDIYTLGTMVSAMTVADIRQFDKQSIFDNVGAFQSLGLKPGQMVALVDMYMEYGDFGSTTLQSFDLEKLRRLIPAVNYEMFLSMDVNTINLQLNILKDLAIRAKNRYPLTAAQKYTIARQLTVSTDVALSEMIVSSLGAALSMELSPRVFLDLSSLSDLGMQIKDDGTIQFSTIGQQVISQDWSEFQKTVFFRLYRKGLGPKKALLQKALIQMRGVASGITTDEIFNSRFTDIVGLTTAVMTHGSMGKAWLMSLEIRRSFAAMYGLESIDQFHLGLLGTANLMALDGLTLRMFSVKEMEGLSASDCQDVISKIGNRDDVYLIPFPKRRELVCFYIERCRFDYSATQRKFTATSTTSILQSYNPDDPRISRKQYRYARKIFDYCVNLAPVSLTASDYEVLGNLVCDIPASVLAADRFPMDVLWMFSACSFTEEQGKALFEKLTTGENQGALYTDTTLSQLSHSLCSIVPPQHASQMRSKRYRKEIIDFVQYAYDFGKKSERKNGLVKKHLNKDRFWYQGLSMRQQENIVDCYIRMARNALDFFRDYEQVMFQRNVVEYDERLNLNPNTFGLRPVYLPKNPQDYNDLFYNMNNDGSDDNSDWNNVYDFGNDVEDAGNDDDVGYDELYDDTSQSRQRREYFDYFQEKILCPEVHVLNTGNRLWSLMDLEWMQPEELSRCIYYFGNNNNMTFQQRTVLKDKIAMLVGGWENIPAEYLIQMGAIALTMREWELRALKMDNHQVNYFVAEWAWEKWQRETLYENIRRRFNLYPSGMELWQLKALGEFICGMRADDLARIYTENYFELAFFFGELTTCDYNQLRMLLPKAKSTASFGPVSSWTEVEIIAIGSPLAALSVLEFDLLTPSKNAANSNLVAAIPPHVIPLIPVHNLKRLRVEFFQSMTIEQVIAMSPVQWHALNDGQAFAAMDIWFGFDNWPMSFLRDLQASSVSKLNALYYNFLFPLLSLYLSYSLFV